MFNANQVLSFIFLFSISLMSCAPSPVMWQRDDLRVEWTKEPDVHKIVQGDHTLYYKVRDSMAYLDDHVLLGPVDENGILTDYLRPMGSTRSDCVFWIFCPQFRWPLGVIPYTLHPKVNAWQARQIELALERLHETTDLKFVVRQDHHEDYVEFHPGRDANSCGSYLGRRGGRQVIQLGKNGCSYPSVLHEIGHAIGLLHEHQRCDRDRYISIHWNEMSLLYFFNFVNLCFMGKDHGPYDATSNMQYPAYAFSKGSKPTITLKAGGLPRPSVLFSEGDLQTIQSLYAKEFEKR